MTFQKGEPPPPREPQELVVHLYRGAPAVRGWSVYQRTVRDWTLCGSRARGETRAIETAGKVTCQYCLQLLLPSRGDRAT